MLMTSKPRAQRGITLIESLIAILIMALGILGVLGVQMRTLSDTQTSVRRAQAIRVIEDLSERIKVNPNGLANINTYLTSWTNQPTAAKSCIANTCSNAELATYDIALWKASIAQVLPGGNATVFVSKAEVDADPLNRRQLGVMISWLNSEMNASDTKYLTAIDLGTGSNVTCETGKTCHLQYIPLTGRCTPYFASPGVPAKYYCSKS